MLAPLKSDISRRLPCPLSLPHLFLARCPSDKMKPFLWSAVCLSYFYACDRARACSFKLQKEGRLSPVAILRRCEFTARVSFWSSLLDFAHLTLLPPKYLDSVPTDHPFLYRSPSGRLAVEFAFAPLPP